MIYSTRDFVTLQPIDSWRDYPAKQQPHYPCNTTLKQVLSNLYHYPPLVNPQEIRELKDRLKEAKAGKRLILQGGDCAERFKDCNPTQITAKMHVLQQMAAGLAGEAACHNHRTYR